MFKPAFAIASIFFATYARAQATSDTTASVQRSQFVRDSLESERALLALENQRLALEYQRQALEDQKASRANLQQSMNKAQARADNAMVVYAVVSIAGLLVLLVLASK